MKRFQPHLPGQTQQNKRTTPSAFFFNKEEERKGGLADIVVGRRRSPVPYVCIALLLPALALAQPTNIPHPSPSHDILDRLAIKTGVEPPFHPEIRGFGRQDAVHYAQQVDSLRPGLSHRYRADLDYLLRDNTEWLPDTGRYAVPRSRGIFGLFYRTPAHFFEVNTPHFRLRANPLFNFNFGKETNDEELLFANQRGLEVRGDVDGRLFFYTSLIESQTRFPDFVLRRVQEYQAVPGAGFYKDYRSEVFNIRNGFDFNVANAYIGFNATRHLGVQFGHGRHFIGNGYRSLLLSDFGNYAFFLKLNARVWKFHYQSLFLELSPISQRQGLSNEVLPKKYAAIHYLNFRPTPRLAFGFFEATVFNRSRQFELQYLNPVILYRTVEGMIGSPDNVLIGLNGRWDFARRFQVYGQFLLDEFLLSAVYKPEEKGWWGNKFGLQAGIKYIDAFGVDHLDLQLEHNRVRPYTYSSFDSLNSYTHYNQPLAHPLWANFEETVVRARYQPWAWLTIQARWMHARAGEDTPAENWGASPLLSNGSRMQDYGNAIGQGVGAAIDLFGLDFAWQIHHNLFLDVNAIYRRKNSADDARDRETHYLGAGLRLNIWNQPLDF